MQTKWTWCCCGCPKCSACAGNEGPEMIWTHLKGMASTCAPHNRNLEMPYYGRALGGCGYTVKGEDPDVDSLFAIFPDGHAEFRSRQNAVPDLDYRYPDCAGGLQLDMDCVTWTDAGASWDCCPGVCDCTNGELEVLGVGPRQILDNDEGAILDEAGNPIVGIITSECGGVVLGECLEHCNQGRTPRAFRVEISGVIPVIGPEPVEGCDWFNGTFICDERVPERWPPEDSCQWILYFEDPPGGGAFPGEVSVELSFQKIIVRSLTPTENFSMSWQDDLLSGNCDEIDMVLGTYLGSNSTCDGTNATVRVTAIP